MSSGVQYNISVAAGNSNQQLTSIIQLLTQSVAQTVSLQSAVNNFASAATTGLHNVESAVGGLAGDIRGNLNPALNETTRKENEAEQGANRFGSSLERLGKGAFYLNNIRSAVSGVVDDFNKLVQPGIELDSQLRDMQAITGVTDTQLKGFSNSARENAKEFGTTAATGVAGYKRIVASLGPEFGKNEEAIASMGREASILSKQLGGDVEKAASIGVTAIQQFGVATDKPLETAQAFNIMGNIMSAAAQEGSAELPDLASALEQTGMMAKTANISFVETNAALEVLANKGKKGAEGGVALRNTLSILSEGTFLPPQTMRMLEMANINVKGLGDKTKSLSERLSFLKPIQNDVAAMTMLFGKENVAAGMALVNNTDAIDALVPKLTGTNSAMEQANIVMESYKEKQNRITSAIQDFGISIFNSMQPFIPFITMGMGALQVTANLAMSMELFSMIAKARMWPAIGQAIVAAGSWIATTTMATLAQLGWNAALSMNPIGALIIGISAAVGAIVLLVKYWDDIWGAIKAFGVWVWEHSPFKFLIDVVDRIFPGFKKSMGELWDWVQKKFEALIGWFKKAWDWIKGLFGGGNGKDAASDASKAAVEEYKKQLDKGIPGITIAAPGNNDSPVKDFVRGRGGRHGGLGEGSRSMASGVSGGGTRPTVINLTIHKLQDKTEIHTVNLREGAKEASDTVIQQLLLTLQSVASKGQAGGY